MAEITPSLTLPTRGREEKVHFGKARIFLILCVSFIVGAGLGKYINNYTMAIAAMIFIMLVTLGWRPEARSGKICVVVGFAGLILLLGAWRWQGSFVLTRADNFVGKYYGQEVQWEGVVVRDPDVRSNKVNLTVKPRQIPHPTLSDIGEGQRGEVGRELGGNILLNVGRYPEYQYGDRLKFSGKLEEPFVTEEFSYKDYLSRYDTYAVIRFPKVEKIGGNQGNQVTAALLKFKHKLQDVITSVLPEPASALLLGIILGLKRSLPEGLSAALVTAGVSHIIVISGYNISIITKNMLRGRAAFGHRAALVLSAVMILAFVIMTGAEASVARAAIMGFALIAALGAGRLYMAQNAVIFAGAAMVWQNPKILTFDIGFQLSFAATLGIIYLCPILEKALAKIPEGGFLSLRSNLAATTAALTFTLPLLLYHFERLSVYALPANILILWAVPYVMFLGMALAFSGLLWLPAAKIIGAAAWVLLEWIIWLAETVVRLPLASASLKVNTPIIIVYYGLLIAGIWLYRKKKGFRYYVEYVEMKL